MDPDPGEPKTCGSGSGGWGGGAGGWLSLLLLPLFSGPTCTRSSSGCRLLPPRCPHWSCSSAAPYSLHTTKADNDYLKQIFLTHSARLRLVTQNVLDQDPDKIYNPWILIQERQHPPKQ